MATDGVVVVVAAAAVVIVSMRGTVRGLFSAKVPNSSFAEVHMGLLIEPSHMEDEDEDQENEKEDERDGEGCEQWRVERVSRQQHHG